VTKLIDMTGKRINKLTITGRAPNTSHGNAIWLCDCDCGKKCAYEGCSLRTGKIVSCGCYNREKSKIECEKRVGTKNPGWKGGRQHSHGYILLLIPDHPNASKRGLVAEQIFVMSQFLGRPLLKSETVHHKNGVKTDNRIENLELWASRHPKGQRDADLTIWAIEHLAQRGYAVKKE